MEVVFERSRTQYQHTSCARLAVKETVERMLAFRGARMRAPSEAEDATRPFPRFSPHIQKITEKSEKRV